MNEHHQLHTPGGTAHCRASSSGSPSRAVAKHFEGMDNSFRRSSRDELGRSRNHCFDEAAKLTIGARPVT